MLSFSGNKCLIHQLQILKSNWSRIYFNVTNQKEQQKQIWQVLEAVLLICIHPGRKVFLLV